MYLHPAVTPSGGRSQQQDLYGQPRDLQLLRNLILWAAAAVNQAARRRVDCTARGNKENEEEKEKENEDKEEDDEEKENEDKDGKGEKEEEV